MRTRDKKINIYLSEKEYEHLTKETKKAGLTISAFIRSRIAYINIKPIPPEQLGAILSELSAIGNNINQLARLANSTKSVSQSDIAEVKTLLFQIMQRVKLI